MPRRVPTSLGALLLLLVAGCSAGRDVPADATDLVAPDPVAAAAAPPFSLFLCADGYRLAPDALAVVDRCNHRVTKPLLDPALLDVVTQHGPGNEVSISVDPNNPLRLAAGAKDYSVSYVSDQHLCGKYTVWMGAYWSTDGGRTWGNDLIRGFPGDPRPSPLQGNNCNTDPVVVFGADGTLYYSGLNYRGARDDSTTSPGPGTGDDLYSGSQLYFARSRDGGATYDQIAFASAGDNSAVFNDKQWFAVHPDGQHLIATWSQFVQETVSVMVYTESRDGGATWSPEQPLRPGATADGAVGVPALAQDSMPQYLPDGATADLAVLWQDGSNVLYAEGVITPAATEFGPVLSSFPVNALDSGPGRDGTGPSRFRSGLVPALGIDVSGGPCNGRRYVAWPDQPGPVDSDVQVLLRYSDDGLDWSAPVTVNDVDAGDQLFPWLDVDSEGGVHVAWMDRRNDPENRLLDVYFAYSPPCGEAFERNVRVTEASFDGDLSLHQAGDPFIGDYMSVDATPMSAHIVWPDTRHTGTPGRPENADVYAATLLRDLSARGTFDAAFAVP